MSKSKKVVYEVIYNDYLRQKNNLHEDSNFNIKNPKAKHKSKIKSVLFFILCGILSNKKRILKCFLFIPALIIAGYLFTWVHEFGHVIAALLTGNGVYKIEVYGLFGGGMCYFYWNDYSNPFIPYFMLAGGSLLVLLICSFLSIQSFIKRRLGILFISFIEIVDEFYYWATSPGLGWGDAHLLIKWAEYFKQDDVIEVVLSIKTIFPIVIAIMIGIVICFSYVYFNRLTDEIVNSINLFEMKKAIKKIKKRKRAIDKIKKKREKNGTRRS